MRTLLLLLLLCVFHLQNQAQMRTDRPYISDVKTETNKGYSVITFTLHSSNPSDKFRVWIEPKNSHIQLVSKAISGDIGNLSPGVYEIKWNHSLQKPFPVTLFAQLMPNVATGKALGLSLLYPGAGNRKLQPDKKLWWVGALGYGLVASSVALSQMSGNDYSDYKSSNTNSEANDFYESAIMKRNLAYGAAAGAGLVWTIDLIGVLSKSAKMKNTPSKDIDINVYPLLAYDLLVSEGEFAMSGEVDSESPEIEIISPKLDRGFQAVSIKETVHIKGTALDESGIKEIRVNDKKIAFQPDGSFQTEYSLSEEMTLVKISATDIQNNSSSVKFRVIKKTISPEGPDKIVWLSPSKDNIKTASNNYPIDICISSKEQVEKISLYCNNELVSEEISRQIEFRGECDYQVKKTVDLKVGQNIIRAVAETEGKELVSEKIINYDFGARKYYALLIAVEDYQDPGINDLSEPVKDAERLAKILHEAYTFEKDNVRILKNPTKSDIVGTLHKLRSEITNEDNLLIFYAGHGFWDEDMKSGYWLPADAIPDNPVDWLPNAVLTNYIGAIKSKHTLLIADACFSGGIFKTRNAFNTRTALEKLYQMPSRKAMTSGTLKEVPDKSVFLAYLTRRLTENTNEYITSEQLFSSMRIAVINNSPNIPQYGTIQNTGDEGGDFIFVRRKQ